MKMNYDSNGSSYYKNSRSLNDPDPWTIVQTYVIEWIKSTIVIL